MLLILPKLNYDPYGVAAIRRLSFSMCLTELFLINNNGCLGMPRDTALDENQIFLGAYIDNLQSLDCFAFVAITTGHLLALDDL